MVVVCSLAGADSTTSAKPSDGGQDRRRYLRWTWTRECCCCCCCARLARPGAPYDRASELSETRFCCHRGVASSLLSLRVESIDRSIDRSRARDQVRHRRAPSDERRRCVRGACRRWQRIQRWRPGCVRAALRQALVHRRVPQALRARVPRSHRVRRARPLQHHAHEPQVRRRPAHEAQLVRASPKSLVTVSLLFDWGSTMTTVRVLWQVAPPEHRGDAGGSASGGERVTDASYACPALTRG